MGAAHSRRHNRNRENAAQTYPQPPQVPPPYPYPFSYSARNGGNQDAGFMPFLPYPQGVQQYGTERPTMPQTHQRRSANSAGHRELQQTKTIRNRVNLKKPSLKFVRLNDNENKLVPKFTFDASSACSVTVFFVAQEELANRSKLTSIFQTPGPRAMYKEGLTQTFPPEGRESEYALDLSLYLEEDLTRINGDVTYPLIIRLETVGDDKEIGDLEKLEPGCPMPSWVQSQTTYANLIKEDNEWEPRTVKQKISVDGISYELQEIYGIQDIYQDKKADKVDNYSEDIEGRECVICLAALRDTTVLPCRHLCMCASCAKELQRQQVSTCPICRDSIESLLHIKRPEKKSVETEKSAAAKST